MNGIPLRQLVKAEALAHAQFAGVVRIPFNGLLNPVNSVFRRVWFPSVEVSLVINLETADVFFEPGQFLVNRHRGTSRGSARYAIITPPRGEAPKQKHLGANASQRAA